VARRQERRVLVLGVIVALAFLGIIGRLVQIQVVAPDRYVEFGADVRTRVDVLPAARGSIFDRFGEGLVLPGERFSVAVDPKLIAEQGIDAEALAADLEVILNGDAVAEADSIDVLGALSAPSEYELLSDDVPVEVIDDLRENVNIDGIIVDSEPTRFWPGGDLASTLLGTVDKDNRGLNGVERRWDHLLVGTDGQSTRERDGRDRTIESGVWERVDPIAGQDLFLTIDYDLQLRAEQIIGDGVARLGAESGVAIISRPQSGEILAMVNMDRNDDTGFAEVSPYNRAVVDTFEAGSVMKIIPYAAALHDGKLRMNEKIDAPEQLTTGGVTIHNSHDEQSGMKTPGELIAYSSNTGANLVAMRLGDDRYHDWIEKFGFGRRTALRLPGESRGVLRDTEDWTESSAPAHSIGHEMTVTASQLISAYNVIWNDGLSKPSRLLSATRASGESEAQTIEPADGQRVISPQVATQMRNMLTGVVDDGTASLAAIDDYSVAGKTGTARRILGEGNLLEGTYGEDGNREYTSSFSGALPAGDPELSIVVVLNNPLVEYSGGKAAAPLFRELAIAATTHLGISPDRPPADDRNRVTFAESAAEEPAIDYTGTPKSEIQRAAALLEQEKRTQNAAEAAAEAATETPGQGIEPAVSSGRQVADDISAEPAITTPDSPVTAAPAATTSVVAVPAASDPASSAAAPGVNRTASRRFRQSDR